MSQVTGQTDATATTTTQSETAGTTSFVNGTSRIVGSFNDETPDANLIIYGATTRHTKKGATQMGWSYSDNGGANWTYWRKPPASLRMGSAVGRSGDDDFGHLLQRGLYVQPCNPEHQISGGGIDGSVVTGSGKTSYIGGACIVKSKDGGKTFAHFQCVQNTDPVADVSDSTLGHFYDGGSMASTPAGEVFAAFVDVATAQIDVWRSPDGNKPFQRIATPFPNYVVASHHRLRIAPDGTLTLLLRRIRVRMRG